MIPCGRRTPHGCGAKIPELMRGMGRGVREFKDAMNTDYSSENKKPNPADVPGDKPADK